jgi:Dolichyl-phosphate-mannose-protein mannosyltransferase
MDTQLAATKERPYTRVALRAVAVSCFCAALLLLTFSLNSFEQMRGLAVSSVSPAYRDRFTPGLYHKIVLSLWLGSAALGMLGVSIWISTQQFAAACAGVAGALRDVYNAARQGVRDLRADGVLHWAPLLIVVVWGIALRLRFYFEPLRHDEVYTFLHYASRPLFIGIAYYTANNHLLNTLLMHMSTALFGNAPWALRLPTLTAGLLLIPISYAAVRCFAGRNAGLLATALVSGSSALIEFSFNARGYMLSALLFTAGTGLICLNRRGVRRALVLLPPTAALMMYSVPTMVYAVSGMFLCLLIMREKVRRVVAAGIATALITGLLYLPVLATVGPAAISHNQWVAPIPRASWGPALVREARGLWTYWALDMPAPISLLIAAGLVFAFVSRKIRRQTGPAIFASVAGVTLALMLVQSVVPPRRTFLFLLPLYFGVAAAAWTTWLRQVQKKDVVCATVALFCTAAMGMTVLQRRSLDDERHIEAFGLRSAEPMVVALRSALAAGDQFVCSNHEDADLTYRMMLEHVHYHPLPQGGLLILVPFDDTPEDVLKQAGISPEKVRSLHRIGHFEDRDVYAAKRTPALPFLPEGNISMGWFE